MKLIPVTVLCNKRNQNSQILNAVFFIVASASLLYNGKQKDDKKHQSWPMWCSMNM